MLNSFSLEGNSFAFSIFKKATLGEVERVEVGWNKEEEVLGNKERLAGQVRMEGVEEFERTNNMLSS